VPPECLSCVCSCMCVRAGVCEPIPCVQTHTHIHVKCECYRCGVRQLACQSLAEANAERAWKNKVSGSLFTFDEKPHTHPHTHTLAQPHTKKRWRHHVMWRRNTRCMWHTTSRNWVGGWRERRGRATQQKGQDFPYTPSSGARTTWDSGHSGAPAISIFQYPEQV
jgi:hypothetical protein